MAYIRNVRKYLHNIAASFCILAIFIITSIVFYSVIMRYVFKSAPFWAEEVARYLLVWTSLLGASIAFENREHVGIEFITDKLPSKIKNKLLLIMDILTLIFFTFVIIYGIKATILGWKTVSPATGIRMSFPYLGIPVGIFFCFAQVFLNIVLSYNSAK